MCRNLEENLANGAGAFGDFIGRNSVHLGFSVARGARTVGRTALRAAGRSLRAAGQEYLRAPRAYTNIAVGVAAATSGAYILYNIYQAQPMGYDSNIGELVSDLARGTPGYATLGLGAWLLGRGTSRLENRRQ